MEHFFGHSKGHCIATYCVSREIESRLDSYTNGSELRLGERPTYSEHERLRFFFYGNFARWPRNTYVKRKCCRFSFFPTPPERFLRYSLQKKEKSYSETCNVSYRRCKWRHAFTLLPEFLFRFQIPLLINGL